MSEHVVHFSREYGGRTAYDNVMSILYSRTLRAVNPFGIARLEAPDLQSQNVACFSEIPLHLLSRLAERRGPYGIGFTKEFLLASGGGPVWYVENRSPSQRSVSELVQRARAALDPRSDPVWSITPFIDAPGDYPGGAYRFEWEREWRVIGDLHFRENQVAFLVIPEHQHGAARDFFRRALREGSGPAYLCPYIDPYWNLEKVRGALQGDRE